MRKIAIGLTAAILAFGAGSALAAGQARPYLSDPQAGPPSHQQPGRPDPRDNGMRGHDDRGRDNGGRGNGGQGNDDQRYGRWDSSWGGRPPAPPAHFRRANDWNRHVRACQVRYRSYNPRTDTYVVRGGRQVRCAL